MIRLSSILMSLTILFQSFGICFSDLSQMGELVEHAKFHSEEYGDDFFVFVSKHYGELKTDHEKQHQEEKEEHEKLPFQHISHLASSAVYILNSYATEFKSIEYSEFKTPNFFYQEPVSSLHAFGILQPPRIS